MFSMPQSISRCFLCVPHGQSKRFSMFSMCATRSKHAFLDVFYVCHTVKAHVSRCFLCATCLEDIGSAETQIPLPCYLEVMTMRKKKKKQRILFIQVARSMFGWCDPRPSELE
ncbi:hypothetical protein CEXT_524381 [Caerostris extrusa]|uniref:Uncharacterized protein n=1 Tax=Caerostris extrusa TaxID=172846 RepID=A0AAV4XNN1_CAEEX|nr:hypothetical protein CEXT_524381 [Caerostris extrusa]